MRTFCVFARCEEFSAHFLPLFCFFVFIIFLLGIIKDLKAYETYNNVVIFAVLKQKNFKCFIRFGVCCMVGGIIILKVGCAEVESTVLIKQDM